MVISFVIMRYLLAREALSNRKAKVRRLSAVLGVEGLFHQRRDQAVNGSVEGAYLLDDGGGEVAVRYGGHHEEGFGLLGNAPVHLGNLELVLEVGYCP